MKSRFTTLVMLVALIFAWQPAQAKDEPEDDKEKRELITIKYCDSYEDFNKDVWHSTDSVWLIKKSRTKQFVQGGGDYVFKSDNKTVKKHLQNKAFAVMYNDTLLINAWIYRVAAGYERVIRMTDGRFLFRYFSMKKLQNMGILPFMSAKEQMPENDVCYLVVPNKRDATIINQKVMADLLKDHPSLLEEYNAVKKKQRNDADVILPLMRKAKLLKEE